VVAGTTISSVFTIRGRRLWKHAGAGRLQQLCGHLW
jgi:hypothetical protein